MLKRIFPQSDRFRCPDEHQLAAYVDQQLIGTERERVESHLGKCDSCLQQVGFLVRQSTAASVSPPAPLVRRAEQLQLRTARSAPPTWRWAVAASVALVTLSVALWRQHQLNVATERHSIMASAANLHPEPVKPQEQTETAVRSVSPDITSPILLSPKPGATVPISELVVRWEPIATAVAYELRITTSDGDLVWRQRVKDTSVRVTAAPLRTGDKYFVWVRALLSDGRTQQSAAVSFVGG